MVLRLTELQKGMGAVVEQVDDPTGLDPIARRLRDLGFVPGEPLRVVASGPIGRDPMLVVIGSTRFALRRSEAGRITVREVSPDA